MMKLLLRRGLDADRTSITPDIGEPLYTTDTKALYIGDGATPGGNPLSVAASWAAITGKPATFPPDAHAHDDLYFTEAEITTLLAGKADTSHGHAATGITYNNATSGLLAVDVQAAIDELAASGGGGGATTLDGLTDVSTAGAVAGDSLVYNGAGWAPGAGSGGGTTYTSYVTVNASRALTAADHGKTLRATGAITITTAPGLPDGFRCDILNVGTDIVTIAAGASTTLEPGAAELNNSGGDALTAATVMHYTADAFEVIAGERPLETIMVALGDETSDLTTGTAKVTLHMPYAFLLTGVRFGVNEAPTGSAAAFDVNVNGASILSTTATIDAGEATTVTAATPPAISNGSIADAAVVTFDIDAVGSTTPGKGAKAYLYGYRV